MHEGPTTGSVPTRFIEDDSKSILSENNSPDVGFRFSVNPYRGCEHGCIYCYARATHEYLGFSAGLDYETRISVKHRAPDLLDSALRSRAWRPQTVALCGNTDAYQPVERRLQITRRCLRVLEQHQNPVAITTKGHLICRDLDILRVLASRNLVSVTISLTTQRKDLSASMEPRASTPTQRTETIRRLREGGVPVGVNIAPVIPGLNDEEIPALTEAAADAGAMWADYCLLRLPSPVDRLFLEWMDRIVPGRRDKICSRIRGIRNGALSEERFGVRWRGSGSPALDLRQLFQIARKRCKLLPTPPELSTEHFRSREPRQMVLHLPLPGRRPPRRPGLPAPHDHHQCVDGSIWP